MRKNFGSKPFLYPMPVLIIGTYDENGVPNAMNAAWGAISDYTQISVCVSSGHKTMKNIRAKKAFTVSIADAANVVAADYVGIVSGNKVLDKFENTGWHAVKSENVDAPIIEELPMTLECTMASYDEESEMLVGDIVNICADERVLSEDGKIDPAKLDPITYDPINNTYLRLGQKVGDAFADGTKLK
ncbi:MAG: flavin reductase family protein [Firmicutes bacterium]|nr:flavin reductase family protein [Bacillota bacterium]